MIGLGAERQRLSKVLSGQVHEESDFHRLACDSSLLWLLDRATIALLWLVPSSFLPREPPLDGRFPPACRWALDSPEPAEPGRMRSLLQKPSCAISAILAMPADAPACRLSAAPMASALPWPETKNHGLCCTTSASANTHPWSLADSNTIAKRGDGRHRCAIRACNARPSVSLWCILSGGPGRLSSRRASRTKHRQNKGCCGPRINANRRE